MENKKIFIPIYFIFVLLLAFSSAKADEKPLDRMSAVEIYSKYRQVKPVEIQTWKQNSKLDKNTVKLINNYFSIVYPKCLTVSGEEGEGDPKKAGSIRLSSDRKCPESDIDMPNTNMSIGLDYDLKNLSNASFENTMIRQPLIVNSERWDLLIGVTDVSLPDKPSRPMIRWEAFTICKKKTYHAYVEEIPGQPSLDRIKSNHYDPPNFFKQIVTSFQCHKK